MICPHLIDERISVSKPDDNKSHEHDVDNFSPLGTVIFLTANGSFQSKHDEATCRSWTADGATDDLHNRVLYYT